MLQAETFCTPSRTASNDDVNSGGFRQGERREIASVTSASVFGSFSENFFAAFALAFSSRENCAFALRLLRAWLNSATDRAAISAATNEQRLDEHRVAALLRMLTSFLRQFAPSECSPEQFTALAPAVVRASQPHDSFYDRNHEIVHEIVWAMWMSAGAQLSFFNTTHCRLG